RERHATQCCRADSRHCRDEITPIFPPRLHRNNRYDTVDLGGASHNRFAAVLPALSKLPTTPKIPTSTATGSFTHGRADSPMLAGAGVHRLLDGPGLSELPQPRAAAARRDAGNVPAVSCGLPRWCVCLFGQRLRSV